MAFQIQPTKFNLNRLKCNDYCLIIGKRRSGKSVLIKELMHHFDKDCGIKAGVICSHSEDVDPFYKEFFPDLFIYNNCNLMCKRVIERQEKLLEENEELRNKGEPEKDNRILVVLDDVIDDPTLAKNEDFNNIIYNGKHYNITLIISVQYVKALPPGARQNPDVVFLFNTDSETEIKKMYDTYGEKFPSEKVFKNVLLTFTKNYQSLVLYLNYIPDATLNDKISFFKADINLKYDKFGSDEFNEFQYRFLNN